MGQLPQLVAFVASDACTTSAVEAYNAAITALKSWRDSHITIVTLYIIQPSLHAGEREKGRTGTASGNLCQRLKSMRDATTSSLVVSRPRPRSRFTFSAPCTIPGARILPAALLLTCMLAMMITVVANTH